MCGDTGTEKELGWGEWLERPLLEAMSSETARNSRLVSNDLMFFHLCEILFSVLKRNEH